MSKEYNLDRFIDAQENMYATYQVALKEIKAGRKVSHWIWYIFPQIKGLGKSYEANYYGIANLEEAKLYLEHEVLGKRLYEMTQALYELDNVDPDYVMGTRIDAMKLKSSMTLFEYASEDKKLFTNVLDKFFGGKRDYKTIRILEQVR